MKVRSNHVQGYMNMKIPFDVISRTESPKGLAIMLPGMGYTVKSPIFHYTIGIYLNKGYEVLAVNYPYHLEDYDHLTFEELKSAVIYDVKRVLENVMSESNYESYYIVGKSFGTLAMPTALQFDQLQHAKAVWLTPILKDADVFQTMKQSQNQGLCIIGDKDQFYNKEQIEELKQNENMEFDIPPGANHILEFETDILASIDSVKKAIQKIDSF